MNLANLVHFILQGKGGVGKSFVASLFSQYLVEQNKDLLIIDTDPINRTVAGFKGLHAHEIQLMDKGQDIDASKFDKLMGLVIEHDGDSLIDNGASSFVPLSSYLLKNEMLDFIAENGKGVVIHTLITGGQALFDTLSGMDSIIRQYPPECQIIVWLNEFQGAIEDQGKDFLGMKVYQTHQERIAGIIRIPKQDQLFDEAIRQMMKQRMTFQEVQQCTDADLFDMFKKRRISMFKKDLWEQLDALHIGANSLEDIK